MLRGKRAFQDERSETGACRYERSENGVGWGWIGIALEASMELVREMRMNSRLGL